MKSPVLLLAATSLLFLACGDKDPDTGGLTPVERGCQEVCSELAVQCEEDAAWTDEETCTTECVAVDEVPSNYRIRCIMDAADCDAARACTQEPL